MTKALRCILLVAVAASSIGAAKPHQPTARWVVNFDDTQCIASRNYGTEEKPLFLVLKTPPLGSVIQIGMVRNSYPADARQLDAQVVIDQRPPLRMSMLTFTAEKQKQRAYLINLPIQDFAPARTAKAISIRASGLNERFAISAMEPLMKIMDDCVADLRKVWNVTETNLASPNLKEPVRGSLQGVIEDEDYPAVSIAEGQSGTVTLALLVNEAGRVADCTVIGTSGAAALDAQSCIKLMARARLKPAIGLDGKPAKGSVIQRISWRVED